MSEQFTGLVEIKRTSNEVTTITLDGDGGDIFAGGQGVAGELVLRSTSSQDRIRLNAASGDASFGGNGTGGNIRVFASGGDNQIPSQATVRLSGAGGVIVGRTLALRSTAGISSISLFGEDSTMVLGDTLRLEGNEGTIFSQNLQLRSTAGTNSIFLGGDDSTILLGSTLRLDGNAGDIILQNADCAEEFAIADGVDALPGSVMVLDDNGLLQLSSNAYDKCVVGIISGAGNYRPGLVLDKQVNKGNRSPVAVMGKVYCMVTAEKSPIRVGDLLTTSNIVGHAMKVEDSQKAFGAVIGKALAPLEVGTGLIPVLVALQ